MTLFGRKKGPTGSIIASLIYSINDLDEIKPNGALPIQAV